ncbi:hypothetical protein ACFV4P_08860 [Kitasatospora sp. NPDC059795]
MNDRIELFRAPDAAAVLTTLGGGSALSALRPYDPDVPAIEP